MRPLPRLEYEALSGAILVFKYFPGTLMSFPSQILFNGVDYFLYQLDRIMSQSSGNRNICTFVIELENRLDHHQLQQILADIPAYRWITGLRIRQGFPFTRVRWCSDPDARCPVIAEHHLLDGCEVPDTLFGQTLNERKESPFKIDIVQMPGQSTQLVFNWHHALMDAHGAERFIHYLGRSDKVKEPDWIRAVTTVEQMPLQQRAMIAHAMKKILYETSELPLITLFQHKRSDNKTFYHLISFTKLETELIAQRSREQGAGFLTSAFYLAATARAVAFIQKLRKPLAGDMLVPVPQDRRKRGAEDAVLANQTTFLFYRIPQSVLPDLRRCTAELIKQMVALMRSEIPGNYLILMDLLQHIPGPLYRFLMKSPTAGLMGSFFYSDTGDSLQDYTILFNQKVRSAVHYPPNTCPPGITFIYTRFHGALQITIGYMGSVINRAELEQLTQHLRNDLLASDGDCAGITN